MRVSRFDVAVFMTLGGLALLTGLLAWRGEQRGVTIIARSPAPGAQEVSTRVSIRVTFDQAMDIVRFGTQSFSALPLPLLFDPPVTGTVKWKGATVTFTPDPPLTVNTRYTVTVADNLHSLQGHALQEEQRWQFTTRQPYLLYLAPDQEHILQLTLLNLQTTLARRLSRASAHIQDYTVSPDSASIVYTVSNPQHGGDLWAVMLDSQQSRCLLKCQQDSCSHAVWTPDGTRLVYERKAPTAAESRLWWLELASGETTPVFDDPNQAGYGAGWSPDGTWLSYIDPVRGEMRVVHLKDGRSLSIPNQMGEPPVWHPRQNILVFADILLKGEDMVGHLFRFDPEHEELQDISGEMSLVAAHSPTWSSDGAWLAFSRKNPGELLDAQLVLMRPDGSEVFSLPNDSLLDYGHLVWSPDDRYLVFQCSPVQDMTTPPEIWFLDLQNGQSSKVAAPGRQPAWLP
jgi:Tol biopolymer transport system component